MPNYSPCLPVRESLPRIRKLPKLVPDHLLCYLHRHVILSIVHHEPQADKVWQDARCAGFCEYWGVVLEGISEVGEGGKVGT